MLYATNRTGAKLLLDCISAVVSLPLTYLLIAPKNALIPGLELGSLGFALQLTIITFIDVNFRIWWIDRFYGWKLDWSYQIVGLVVFLALAYLTFTIKNGISALIAVGTWGKLGLNLSIYFLFVGIFLWKFPSQAGLSKSEVNNFLTQYIRRLTTWK